MTTKNTAKKAIIESDKATEGIMPWRRQLPSEYISATKLSKKHQLISLFWVILILIVFIGGAYMLL